MKPIRAILVDDERVGRKRLRRMLEKEPDVEIVAECDDGPAAVRAVGECAPDLLFLDVSMPGMDGFGVLEALGPGRQPAALVFVTAFDEYAVRAFDACAVDYLLKPVSPERLSKAVARARQRVAAAARLPAPDAAPGPAHRFTVRNGGRVAFVPPEEVDWVEAAGNYAILHAGPANHMIRETMSALESQLAAHAFLRVSRSAIVNLRRVRELAALPGGEHVAVLVNSQRVPVTRSIREVTERLRAL